MADEESPRRKGLYLAVLVAATALPGSWVLLPVLLACVPLMFTPLAHVTEASRSADE